METLRFHQAPFWTHLLKTISVRAIANWKLKSYIITCIIKFLYHFLTLVYYCLWKLIFSLSIPSPTQLLWYRLELEDK